MNASIKSTTETNVVNSALAEIEQKFIDQEAQLVKQEQIVATLRAFFSKHREALAPFVWNCYGWNTEIKFDLGWRDQKAKDIARAFGADGWTRKVDGYSCGSINWHKSVGGVELTINAAESIKPKLIEEVKL
jgi:hypothetical protein